MPKEKVTAKSLRLDLRNNIIAMRDRFALDDTDNFGWVIGIDPSITLTAHAFARISSPKKVVARKSPGVIRIKGMNAFDGWRMDKAQKQIIKRLKKRHSILAVLEGYAYSSHNNRELMGEVSGGIKSNIIWKHPELVRNLLIVSPTQLKKFATGKGRGVSKDMVSMFVHKRWKLTPRDNNEADAMVLCKIGLSVYDVVNAWADMMPELDDNGKLSDKNDVLVRKFKTNGWQDSQTKEKFVKAQWEVIITIIEKHGENLHRYDKNTVLPLISNILSKNDHNTGYNNELYKKQRESLRAEAKIKTAELIAEAEADNDKTKKKPKFSASDFKAKK